MNPEAFIENEPWSYAVQRVKDGGLGRVAALSVQAIEKKKTPAEQLDQWRTRLDELFGPACDCDIQRTGSAWSAILRYDGPVLVRLFLEQSAGGNVLNFEIVGSKSLLIWKEDVHPLSNIQTSDGVELLYEHPYPVALGQEAKA